MVCNGSGSNCCEHDTVTGYNRTSLGGDGTTDARIYLEIMLI